MRVSASQLLRIPRSSAFSCSCPGRRGERGRRGSRVIQQAANSEQSSQWKKIRTWRTTRMQIYQLTTTYSRCTNISRCPNPGNLKSNHTREKHSRLKTSGVRGWHLVGASTERGRVYCTALYSTVHTQTQRDRIETQDRK